MDKASIYFIRITKGCMVVSFRLKHHKPSSQIHVKIIEQNTTSEYKIEPISQCSYEFEYHINTDYLVFQINCVIDNESIPFQFNYEYHSPVSDNIMHSYAFIDNYIIKCDSYSIYVKKAKKTDSLFCEAKFQIQLLFHSKFSILDILKRSLVLFLKKIKSKRIILFYDRINNGNDNAEFLFDYLNVNRKGNHLFNSFFLVDKEKYEDYKDTVRFFSKKEKLLFLICDIKISSHAAHYTSFLFENKIDLYRDLISEQKFVYLQHGIIKDEMSDWLNRFRRNIYSIIVSSEYERALLLNKRYLYNTESIWLTGMPRYDMLKPYSNNKRILVAFTWRKYLMSEDFDRVGNRIINNDFKKSKYYKKLIELLYSSKTNELMNKYKYQILFKLHPMFKSIQSFFSETDIIKIDFSDEYIDSINNSDLLITDYSSISFDFAYVYKPVLYYQFDYEEFYSGKHTYRQGAYDYESMGFGKVVSSFEKLLSELEVLLENSAKMEKKYIDRVNSFFRYNDCNNCKRITDYLFKHGFNDKTKS
jgi:CDP-glycerol glycerophosphotransferase (TagB/SpsB family)